MESVAGRDKIRAGFCLLLYCLTLPSFFFFFFQFTLSSTYSGCLILDSPWDLQKLPLGKSIWKRVIPQLHLSGEGFTAPSVEKEASSPHLQAGRQELLHTLES